MSSEDLDKTWIGRIKNRPSVDPGKWILIGIAIVTFVGSMLTAAVGYGVLSNTVKTNTAAIADLKKDDDKVEARLLNIERVRHD